MTKKLAYPLPIKGGAILRTIQDARDYLLALPPHRERLHRWQHVCELILEEADLESITNQFHRALFMDGQLDLSEFERINARR